MDSIPSLVSGSYIPVVKHGIVGSSVSAVAPSPRTALFDTMDGWTGDTDEYSYNGTGIEQDTSSANKCIIKSFEEVLSKTDAWIARFTWEMESDSTDDTSILSFTSSEEDNQLTTRGQAGNYPYGILLYLANWNGTFSQLNYGIYTSSYGWGGLPYSEWVSGNVTPPQTRYYEVIHYTNEKISASMYSDSDFSSLVGSETRDDSSATLGQEWDYTQCMLQTRGSGNHHNVFSNFEVKRGVTEW